MSLDFDRSPDGEPLRPAGQAPPPAQQAPATAPGFTPASTPAEPEPAGAAGEPTTVELVAGVPQPAADEPTAGLDAPLLSDTDELRASWQRIQAGFVDDPREAVADAAGLVEHTAQTLVGALRQRQRQLRGMWDREGLPDGVEYADSGGPAVGAVPADGTRQAADDGPDTEQLRLLIQRYRVLFNDLCRP